MPSLSLLASLGVKRLVSIVLWASLVGVVVGYAVATLSNEDPADLAAGAPAGTAADREGFQASVLRAVLQPAVTPSGIRRRRARLTMSVRVTNTSTRNSSEQRQGVSAPLLIVDSGRLESDPAAAAQAGGLLEPVPAGTTVSGVLRFETAEAVTEELIEQRRGTLRIAGQRLSFEVDAP
ncbi:MAG: hypothetical protein WKF42_01900 [Solirubrobacteraceae bacterium]